MLRSIPARTGEPERGYFHRATGEVYPRAYGGTLLASSRPQGRRHRGQRRLGGLRRRREETLEGAYDLHEGFRSVDGILRFAEIAALDLLGLDTSVARSNAMFRGALVAAKLLEVGDLAQRLATVEATLAARQPDPSSPSSMSSKVGRRRVTLR